MWQDLVAVVNGQEYVLVSEEEGLCLRVQEVADFNGNGYNDALVEVLHGCGGNCCGNGYFVASFDGQAFYKTRTLGEDWDGAEVVWDGNWANFIIEARYQGFNAEMGCNDSLYVLALDGYRWMELEVTGSGYLEALAQLTAEQLVEAGRERGSLAFDLDGDGAKDVITAEYWERWGTLGEGWTIHFSGGGKFVADFAGKRIGVLPTQTYGVHDLVIGCDNIYYWDGEVYRLFEE